MIVIVENRETCYVIIGVIAENDTDCRIISFRSLQFIIHSYIHIHLTDILMTYF